MNADIDFPKLPKSWTGESVHRLDLEGPVAVIGDIHGARDKLALLLKKLKRCQILVTGDIGDRGPDTKGCIDLLIEAGARGVMGNHDLWLSTWAAGEGFDVFALNPGMGGVFTLESYGVSASEATSNVDAYQAVPTSHRDWLLDLHVAIDLHIDGTPYWLIHAGLPNHFGPPPGLTLAGLVPWMAANHPELMMWPPNEPENMLYVGRPIIMGHRTRDRVLQGDVIAVDTSGGHPDRPLSAVILPAGHVVSVNV